LHRLPELMDGLFLLTGPNNPPMVQIAAIRELLDRLLGKPQVTVEAHHTSVSVAELYKNAMIRAGQAFKCADGATDGINGSASAASDPAENKSDPTK
jgi:hypothetical protein